MSDERAQSASSAAAGEWHRKRVGGLWDEVGRLQFEFLVGRGLRPSDYLLDVGCGSLRGGVHFIGYLEAGHYFGVDKRKEVLEAGRDVELPRHVGVDKAPTLVVMEDFGFDRLGRRFDVALAQSVFSHLPLNSVIRCLMQMEQALRPGGEFYATFFENPAGKRNIQPIPRPNVGRVEAASQREVFSYFDQNPYHYDVDTFRWICDGTRLRVEYLGDWDHPRGVKMLLFTKQDDNGTAERSSENHPAPG